jgi:hypothetical protein
VPSAVRRGEPWRRCLVRLGLCTWCGLCLALMAALALAHDAAPSPPALDDPHLVAASREHATTHGQGRWLMVHVLCERCACSRAVVQGLLERRPRADVSERVILAGGGQRLRSEFVSAGYPVDEIAIETLRVRWSITAVPMLVVADPAGRLRYAGGYLDRAGAAQSRDLEILAELRSGASRLGLPVVGGCVTSAELERALDPLGVKRLLVALGAASSIALEPLDTVVARTPGERR